MAALNVAFVRPELEEVLPKYTLIDDCLSQRVKDKGELYLPRPNPDDYTPANFLRYEAYLTRAIFYDVTSRTLNGLVGQMFTNDPEIKLPPQLEKMLDDSNGNGVSLVQNAKAIARQTVGFGRGGLFTDYPVMEKDENGNPIPTTVAQLDSGEIKPTIVVYKPDSIINWQKMRKGARHIHSLIVLTETKQVAIDDFKYEVKQVFKVLRLVKNAATGKYEYQIEIYTPRPKVASNAAIEFPTGELVGVADPAQEDGGYDIEYLYPRDAKGKPLEEIPFEFVGAENNDSDVDPAPLHPMAELNIGHYRNSADYEEACFVVGQPTYVVSGLTDTWYNDVLKGKLSVGSRGGIPLPVDADAKILQVEPNTMAREAMEHKEKQMAAIGARLVEQKEVQQTATEAGINSATENSSLANIAKNVSAALTASLRHALKFTGGNGEVEFTLNTDFAISRMTPEERAQLVAEWTAGVVSWSEVRRGLRDSGIAIDEDEIAKQEIEQEAAKKADQEANAAKKLAEAVPPAPVGPR